MAKKYLMSWEGHPYNRWVKMYKGVRYRVSCEELNAPLYTKEASYRLANSWWMRKLAELNRPDPRTEALNRNRYKWQDIEEMRAKLHAAEELFFAREIQRPGPRDCKDMEQNQISELRKQLADVRELLKRADPNTERHEKAKKIEAQIADTIDQHRLRLLELGASGRLLIAGEIEEVLPLDDADLLDRAKPVTPESTIRLDPEKLKVRRDAQVKGVLEKGAFGLIVLGGAHDLSDNMRRLGQGRCEYIRVTTRRYKEFSE